MMTASTVAHIVGQSRLVVQVHVCADVVELGDEAVLDPVNEHLDQQNVARVQLKQQQQFKRNQRKWPLNLPKVQP